MIFNIMGIDKESIISVCLSSLLCGVIFAFYILVKIGLLKSNHINDHSNLLILEDNYYKEFVVDEEDKREKSKISY